jgi:hypothetical protein
VFITIIVLNELSYLKWQFQKKLENGSFPLRFYENWGWPLALAPRFHIAVPRRRRRSLICFGFKLGYVPGAAIEIITYGTSVLIYAIRNRCWHRKLGNPLCP